MMKVNKVLKLTDSYGCSEREVAAIHYGYCMTFGKVAYTTAIPMDNNKKIDNVLLMVGNEDPIFYWCHVEDMYSFGKGHKGIKEEFNKFSPYMFKEENTTWLLFDKIELLPKELTTILCEKPDLIQELIEKPRSNHKNI